MRFATIRAALDRYRRDGTDFYKIEVVTEQGELIALHIANEYAGAKSTSVLDGNENLSNDVDVDDDDDYWDLEGVMTAAEAEVSNVSWKFFELRSECQVV